MRRLVFHVVVLLGLPVALNATEFYVAPNATMQGNGSFTNPWALQVALTNRAKVTNGDTVWLLGGTYDGGTNGFTCTLAGRSNNPIVVRNFRGQRATIDGRLSVGGADIWIWGLELTTTSQFPSPFISNEQQTDNYLAGAYRWTGLVIPTASRAKFINNIIHDIHTTGIMWSEGAIDSELYGNIVFNCGRMATNTSRGLLVYAQNDTGTKRFINNIGINNAQGGVQFYSANTARVNNFAAEENIIVGNGWGNNQPNFLAGSSQPGTNIVLRQNVFYQILPPVYNAAINVDIGYHGQFWSATIQSNLLVNGAFHFSGPVGQLEIHNNEVHKGVTEFFFPATNGLYVISSNTYYLSTFRSHINNVETSFVGYAGFSNWNYRFGFEANSRYYTNEPSSGVRIVIYPNSYEPGRAHIAICNWGRSNNVEADLSQAGLAPGQRYELRLAQDYFGSKLTGTYSGGTVSIPMTNWPVAQPAHAFYKLSNGIPSTFPEFGAFVLLRSDQELMPPYNLRVIGRP